NGWSICGVFLLGCCWWARALSFQAETSFPDDRPPARNGWSIGRALLLGYRSRARAPSSQDEGAFQAEGAAQVAWKNPRPSARPGARRAARATRACALPRPPP